METNILSSSEKPKLWFRNQGLFSDHYLKARLVELKEWEIGIELTTLRQALLDLYNTQKATLSNMNEAQTEDEFIKPVLDILGYTDSYIVQAPAKLGKQTNRPDYAFFPDQFTKNKAYKKVKEIDYTQCIGIADAKYWERELDVAKTSDRDTYTNQNPSFQIAGYLVGTKQRWGILTNGRLWRLYNSQSHLPLGNYYQIDLVELLTEGTEENLKYFYLLFRKDALILFDGKSFLDRVFEGSNEYAVELEADIKERAYEVVETLCRGFASGFSKNELTEHTLKTVYDNSLTLLYRLLFVLYAEARELLPLSANQSYRDNYSMHNLAQEIDETLAKGHTLSIKSTIYYERIKALSKLINEGDASLGVPEYNGGLFNPTEHPFLDNHAIPDNFLVGAIHQLVRIPDKKLGREFAVDYNTLSERHLGSIYEGLLEFQPHIAPSDLVTVKDKGTIKYVPSAEYPSRQIDYRQHSLYLANDKGERKASGSYYTPEYIVNYIVENTLEPLVKEAQNKVNSLKPQVNSEIAKWQKLKRQKKNLEPIEKYNRKIAEEGERLLEPYLTLKVLDPAMGSGHFLSRATDFIAEAIATDPGIERNLELAEESELTYYRRRVVESCIYGVDLNPLAVELAKLTLWLTTMVKNKPLSFLNHHLKVGNSLIGARINDLDEIPKAKTKKPKLADLSRAPKQIGQFEWLLENKLALLLESRALIAQLPTETLKDIHNKEKWETDFQHNAERFRLLADIWISIYFGNDLSWDTYNQLLDNIQVDNIEWENLIHHKKIDKARSMQKERQFFHWELEFPEVFYQKNGNGKRKDNPGFDALVGNPPYVAVESITDLDRKYFTSRFSFLQRKWDSMVLFLNLIDSLIRINGRIGMIVPVIWQTGENYVPFRKSFLGNTTQIDRLINLPFDVFPDAYVDTSVVIAHHVREIPISYEFLGLNYPKKSSALQISSDPFTKILATLNELKNGKPLIIGEVEKIQILEKCNLDIELLDSITICTQGPVESFLKLHYEKQLIKESVPYAVPSIDRYYIEVSNQQYATDFDMEVYNKFYEKPRILVRRILSRQDRLLACIVDEPFVCKKDFNPIIVTKSNYSREFILSLLNSRLFSWLYVTQSAISLKDDFRQTTLSELKRLPIKNIAFKTPKKRRIALEQHAQELYQSCLNGDSCKPFLDLITEVVKPPKKLDVVHNLLSFLAEEMTLLNKAKQVKIKDFNSWLEKEIIKGSIENQKNKTLIKEFHENTLENLMEILKKNKVIPDPCPSNIGNTIASEFSTAVDFLTPLKARIKATDELIDQTVYRLYGLTDAEIAIVEGLQSPDKLD